MSLIIWRDDYSCGHEVVDSQHYKMVELINQLHADSYLGLAQQRLHGHLEFLFHYVNNHFLLEENLMLLHKLPMESSHRAEHATFRQKLEEIYADFQQGQCDVAGLLELLQRWFVEHMTETDKLTFARLTQAQDSPFCKAS